MKLLERLFGGENKASPKAEPFTAAHMTSIPIGGHKGGQIAVEAVKAFLQDNPGRILEDKIDITTTLDANETYVKIVYVTDTQQSLDFGNKFSAFLYQRAIGHVPVETPAPSSVASAPCSPSARFVFDGCDLTPQRFRMHTVESVEKSLSTKLKNGTTEFWVEPNVKCFTKEPADASRGFFLFAFEPESGLLHDVCIDAKCSTDFLGVRTREHEQVLLQGGFKRIGKFKHRITSWIIWNHSENTHLYVIPQSHLNGNLIEIYYVWRYEPYLDEDVEWLK